MGILGFLVVALIAVLWAAVPMSSRLPHYASIGELDTVGSKTDQAEQLRFTFDKRLEAYKEHGAAIREALFEMLIIASVGLLVLIATPAKLPVPWTEIKVPIIWVALVIPGALLYLWLRFGFSLNMLLGHRLTLAHLAQALDAWPASRADGLRLGYSYGLQHVMDDGFIADAMFITEFPDWVFYTIHSDGLVSVLLVSFGIVMGLCFGVIFALLALASTLCRKHRTRAALFCYFLIQLGLVAASASAAHWNAGFKSTFVLIALVSGAIFSMVFVLAFLEPKRRRGVFTTAPFVKQATD